MPTAGLGSRSARHRPVVPGFFLESSPAQARDFDIPAARGVRAFRASEGAVLVVSGGARAPTLGPGPSAGAGRHACVERLDANPARGLVPGCEPRFRELLPWGPA